MVHSKVASRYAHSLYLLARENSNVDNVLADMVLFAETIHANDELASVIKSPIIAVSKKKAILDQIFKPRFQSITSLFFDLILSKGREFELMGIANAFIHEDKIQKGITEGRLVSAGPLTEELRKELVAKAEKMAGGKVFLEEKINPGLIGGFLLQVGDLQLDASVSSRLTKFKDQVIDHSYVPKIHIPK